MPGRTQSDTTKASGCSAACAGSTVCRRIAAPLLLRGQADSGCAFAAFMAFSDWLWARTCQTSGFTPEALVDHLAVYLIESVDMAGEPVRAALLSDYLASGARASPQALRGLLPRRGALPVKPSRTLTTRQVRHHAPRAAT